MNKAKNSIIKSWSILMVVFMLIIMSINPVAFAQEQSYAIQMGNFYEESSVKEMEAKLNSAGISPLTIKQGSYIVFYGVYPNREQAEANLKYALQIAPDAFITKVNSSESGISKETTTVKPKATSTKPQFKATNTKPKIISNNTQKLNIVNQKQDVNVYNQAFTEDNTMNGVYGSASMYFSISENWDIQNNNYLDIYFKHSLGDEDRGSSITIEVNSVPIDSFFIDKLKETENFRKINIPKENLKVGFNEIKIKTYHRITDRICEDDMNPANWITVLSKSYVHLEYKDNDKNVNISRYPFPYVKEYKDRPIDFKFLSYDEKPSLNEIKAMTMISANAGREVRFKDMKFSIDSAKNMDLGTNYIYVGTRIPDTLKPYIKTNLDLEKSSYIGQIDLKNGKKILFLLSSNSENLPIMANKLSNEKLRYQMADKLITLKAEDILENDDKEVNNTFTFKELGYDNMNLQGAKTSVAQFSASVPQNWKLEDGSKIVLKTRYAKVIDFENSSVTVIINGIPIGSQILKGEYAQEDILTFEIPRELRNEKELSVTIRVYLDGEFDCKDGKSNPNFWFYISNESTLYIPHISKNYYNLEDYPAPFTNDFALQNVNFVIDDNYSKKDMEMLFDVAGFMSRGTTIAPKLDISIGNTIPDMNNIVIGLLDSNLLKNINEKLNIPYIYEKQAFESKKNYLLIDSFNKNLATAQLIKDDKSPYATLVLAAKDYSEYDSIAQFFTSTSESKKLYGDTVFSDSKGYYQIFETREKPKEEVITFETKAPENNVRVTYENARNFIIFMTILSAVIVIIVIVIKSNQNKKKLK